MIISKRTFCLLIAALSIASLVTPLKAQSNSSEPVKCGERLVEPPLPKDTGLRIEQWPWVGALYNGTGSFSPEFVCVVTVLNERFVIIAALCTEFPQMNAPDLTVRLGAANLIDKSESMKIFNVEEILMNSAVYSLNTVALLKLSSKIEFNQFIQPICLKEISNEEKIIGKTGLAAGWKKGWFDSDEKNLREASMSIVENSNCSEPISADNSTFCVARTGVEGNYDRFYIDLILHVGGLYLEDNGKWFIRGVAIVEINRKYWTFSDVAFHLSWLRNTIG